MASGEDEPGYAIRRDDDLGFVAISGPAVFAVTRQPPTLQSLEDLRAVMLEASAHEEASLVLVVVFGGGALPRFDGSIRDKVRAMWREADDDIALSLWLAGSSFTSTLQRSAVSAILMASRRRDNLRMVDSSTQAVDWVLRQRPQCAHRRDAWLAALQAGTADLES